MATAMVMVTAMEVRRKSASDIQGLIVVGVALGCLSCPVDAGEWTIIPTIAVNETATDNVALSNAQKKSDLITDVTPGISIAGSGGRAKLSFDYHLHNLIYANDSTRNQTQNSLNAFGTLEALENWLFIDASGVISQQNISAFGSAAGFADVNPNVNSNTTEASTYRVSPHIGGTIGGFADYQLRYNWSTTGTKSSQAFGSEAQEWLGTLKGGTGLARLSWSLDASSQSSKFDSSSRRDESDRLRGVLTYSIDPAFQVSLIGGREANNYQTLDKTATTSKGAGFNWSPTERTQISASREDRFFGPSNVISIAHRTARTAWTYSESKDATTQANSQAAGGLGTNYDLFFSIFASAIPDPVARAAYVKAQLLANGINPNAQLSGGFLTTGVTLQQRRDLSFALLGARNSVTFAANQTESSNLSQGSGSGFFLGQGFANAQSIRQRTASINWSHKLTGLSSLVGSYARLVSKGAGENSSLEAKQQLMTLNYTTQLGPLTNAGIGARRVIFQGTPGYSENALTGVLSHQF